MIPPAIRNEMRKRYFQSYNDLVALHDKEPTIIETAIHFMITEDGNPKDIKEIIDLIEENTKEK